MVLFFALSYTGYAQVINTVAGNGTSAYCCDGGPATAASINYAYGIAKDGLGNLYISDWSSHRVRKVDVLGVITTVAGTGVAGEGGDGGPATAAQLGWPYGLAVDAIGNLYITDWYYYRVRKVTTTGIITTVAGNGTIGFSGDGGAATAAQIGSSWGIAVDGVGNVFFSDYTNSRIRKINSAGIITTVGGNGINGYSGDGGPATAAKIGLCYGIASDNAGNIYITQWGQGRVRKISTSGIINTCAGIGILGFSGDGGPATAARIDNSYGIAADNYGNVYLADFGNNRIRRVDPTGSILTIGGNGGIGFSGDGGPATAATFNTVFSIGTDGSSNVFVSDYYNSRVRMILGHNSPPMFTGGHTISISVCGNTVFDSVNVPLSVIDSDSWQLATWSLLSGPMHGTAAIAYGMSTTGGVIAPHTLSYTPAFGYSGADTFRVRVTDGYTSDTTMVCVTVNASPIISGSTLIGVGTYSLLTATLPGGTWSSAGPGIASVSGTGLVTGVSPGTTTITYAMPSGCGGTVTVNVFAYAGQMITTIAGNGAAGYTGDGVSATTTSLNNPFGVAADAAGNVYIADNLNNRIRKVNASGIITTIAGTGSAGYSGDGGPATAADLFQPWDIAVDGAGNVYFADLYNSRIRKINTGGIISTVAGNGTFGYFGDGGMATLAYLNGASGIAVDATGNLYICDGYNNRVRKVSTSGIITTIAGTGVAGYSGDSGPATAAMLNSPSRVSVSAAGNVYISDMGNHRIRMINTAGIISTYSGTGIAGFGGDGGPATSALVNNPYGIAVDAIGNVCFGDSTNNRVRRVTTFGVISTIAGNGSYGYSGDHCMATSSSFSLVSGVALDAAGGIYIADVNNNRIRKITFNHAPSFTGGHSQSLSVCQSSVDSINALMSVADIDLGQTEAWSIVTPPANGTLAASYTATITSGTVTPVGIVYAPTIGYTGPDSFKIQVTDCTGGADTTMVHITVTPPPSAIVGAATVCAGLTGTYTDPVGPGTWSSSSPTVATIGSASGVVLGLTAGVATITFAPGAGCSVTKTITINPSPVPMDGTSVVCIGVPVTFTDGTPGGVWSSSSTGVAIVGSSSGVVSGVATGTATISYTQAGCPALLAVTVSAVPPPITGVFNLCAGATSTLSGTGTGTWSSSNPAVGTVGALSGVVTGIAAGTTTISYTISSGCFVTATVTVYPAPTPIAGSSFLCAGQTITLTDGTPGGVWTTSGISIAATIDSFSGAMTGVVAGTATILYSIPGTGCVASLPVTVSPSPAPVTGVAGVCLGNTTTLSDITPGGTWSSGTFSVATVDPASGVVTSISVGVTTISYTVAGCWANRVVSVNAYPHIISVAGHVCAGDTTTASDAGGGTWSSLTPTIASIGSLTGLVTGITAGVATIDYSLPTGCGVTATVTVNASPGAIIGASSICVGALNAYANSVSGGNWSSSNTLVAAVGSSTGYVSGVAVGTAVLTYTLGTGCYVTRPITVNAAPAGISGVPGVCTGSTTTLIDLTPGGVWTSSMPSLATVTTAGVVNGISAGVVNISYTVSGCSTTRSVTISATPTAIAGPATVCAGSMVTESDASTGGVWSTSATTITIGSSSGIVNGLSAGLAVITYSIGSTVSFGGCSVTRTITVNPASAILGSSGLCVGSSTTLTAAGSGTWSSSSPLIASVVMGTGVVTGVGTGIATITFSLSGGCATTKNVTVNITPGPVTGFASVCPGTHTMLSNSAGGGTWTSGSPSVATIGSASGDVTGVALGLAGITYSLGSGCFVTTVVTVNLPPSPVTGTAHVCSGSTTMLSDLTSGGIWTSGSSSIAMVGSATGVVTGMSAGVAVISYTPATGCAATFSMTVNPLPAPISGATNVCIGATTALASTTSGGVWTSISPAIATIGSASGIVSGITVGTDTIVYTLPVTGCAAHAIVSANPLPAPVIGGMMTCIGSSTTLTDITPGGTWSSGTISVATVGYSTGIVSGVSVGSAIITYTAGGCNAITTVTITPLPTPVSGPSVVCAGGGTITLSDVTTGGMWSSSSSAIAVVGSSSGIVTGVAFGIANITYSLGAGCTVVKAVTVQALPSSIVGMSSVCIGATTPMTDPMPGGIWSSSDALVAPVDTAGVVTGLSGGTVSISYTSPVTGCSALHSVTVVTVSPISGITTMCAWGDTIIVHDADTLGSYSSALVTVFNMGGGNGRVMAHAPGIATITYSLFMGCTYTAVITVNPLPASISGIINLCVGATTTLADPTPGGTWSSGNIAVATIGSTTGFLSGLSTGISRISYTLPTGCRVDTAVHVSVPPVAGTISGADHVCSGQTITLTDTASGGIWSSGLPAVALVDTGLVAGVSAGVATISYTVTNPCSTVSATKSVTVYPIPSAGVITGSDSVCLGTLVVLADTVAGGVWSATNGNATVSATGTLTGVFSGTDTIIYTVTISGCSAQVTQTVNILPLAQCTLGLPGNGSAPQMNVWPNPNDGSFYIEMVSAGNHDVPVVISNVLGQKIKEFTLTANKVFEVILSYPPGVYLISAKTDDNTYNVKVQVK